MLCIICLSEKNNTEMSKEHVFPESLGGTFSINKVCIHCNNRLGNEVDHHLVNHAYIKGQRLLKSLKGKSGYIPNPIAVGTLANDSSQKIVSQIEIGKPTFLYFPPSVVRRKGENGTETISVSVDSTKKHKLHEIVNKIRTRSGMPPFSREEIEAAATPHQIENLTVSINMDIDLIQYQKGIYKIVYELACTWIGEEYIHDPTANLIRRRMFDTAPPNELQGKYLINGWIKLLRDERPIWMDDSQSHVAILDKSREGKITAYVRIFNIFEGLIVVSHEAYRYPDFQPRFLCIKPETGECLLASLSEAISRCSKS